MKKATAKRDRRDRIGQPNADPVDNPNQTLTFLPDTISTMDDVRGMAQDPRHRRCFEKLLYLAAKRGDTELVVERLSWGIDPNCTSSKRRTPLIGNVRGTCPSSATVLSLLAAGADPSLSDESGLIALDYARRKLVRLRARPTRCPHKSLSLDENNQLLLSVTEQGELEEMHRELGRDYGDFLRIWWKERLRAARRLFSDPNEVEKIVEMLEAARG